MDCNSMSNNIRFGMSDSPKLPSWMSGEGKLPEGWTPISSGLPPVKVDSSQFPDLFNFGKIDSEMLQC